MTDFSKVGLYNVQQQPRILFIVGPTASGKSTLAMRIARQFGGEIVCADSQTLRRGLDIGTAKPSIEDQRLVTHHMLDIIDPYDQYSVANYQTRANHIIDTVLKQNKLVIVCGGSGLYIDALYYNYTFSPRTNNQQQRSMYEMLTVDELQCRVREKGYSMPTNSTNKRHLIGVLLRNGAEPKNRHPREDAVCIGLLPETAELRQRINARIDRMFNDGLVDEVKRLVTQFGPPPKKLDAIGYPLVADYLQGIYTLEQVVQLFRTGHWQYARRQKTWFTRHQTIHWCTTIDEAETILTKMLHNF